MNVFYLLTPPDRNQRQSSPLHPCSNSSRDPDPTRPEAGRSLRAAWPCVVVSFFFFFRTPKGCWPIRQQCTCRRSVAGRCCYQGLLNDGSCLHTRACARNPQVGTKSRPCCSSPPSSHVGLIHHTQRGVPAKRPEEERGCPPSGHKRTQHYSRRCILIRTQDGVKIGLYMGFRDHREF